MKKILLFLTIVALAAAGCSSTDENGLDYSTGATSTSGMNTPPTTGAGTPSQNGP